MHAFIIEDDYLIGQSLQDMLEKLGFTAFSFAQSEDAAVFGATEQPIDLITADVLETALGRLKRSARCGKSQSFSSLVMLRNSKTRAPNATVIQKPDQGRGTCCRGCTDMDVMSGMGKRTLAEQSGVPISGADQC